jgi:hypothetical protein
VNVFPSVLHCLNAVAPVQYWEPGVHVAEALEPEDKAKNKRRAEINKNNFFI